MNFEASFILCQCWGTKSNQLVKCLGWPCSPFWCPANGHPPNFCGAVWHLLNDSCLDVVGFLFGAGAGFFFAAALAASEVSFKLNLPLDMANMISTQQHPKQATFETSPSHTVAPCFWWLWALYLTTTYSNMSKWSSSRFCSQVASFGCFSRHRSKHSPWIKPNEINTVNTLLTSWFLTNKFDKPNSMCIWLILRFVYTHAQDRKENKWDGRMAEEWCGDVWRLAICWSHQVALIGGEEQK